MYTGYSARYTHRIYTFEDRHEREIQAAYTISYPSHEERVALFHVWWCAWAEVGETMVLSGDKLILVLKVSSHAKMHVMSHY